MNQPAEPGQTAFEQTLTRHADFASGTAIGGRALDFVDARSAGHARVARSGLASYSTGARQLAVELGLRYLPLAAGTDFRPSVSSQERSDLYPGDWRQWIDAELLHLFEDEEEALYQDIRSSAPALRSAPAQVAAALARPRREISQVRAARPAPSVARRAQQLRRLAAVTEQAAPGLSHSLRGHARSRTLALAPSELAERVWISAEQESLPATARALMQASAPGPASSQPSAPSTAPRPISSTVASAVARAVLPTVEVSPEPQLSRVVASRLAPLVGTAPAASREAGRPTSSDPASPAVARLRSPYPGGVGRVASFSGLIAARPTLVQGAAQAASSVSPRVAQAASAPAAEGPRPSAASIETAPSAGSAVRTPLWLDEISLDRAALPGLSASLDRFVSQSERGARSASLLLGADRPTMRTVDALERRALSRAGRADVLESLHLAGASAQPSPLHLRDRSLAESVLLSLPEVARESAVDAGVSARDLNPAAALSETRLGLAARAAGGAAHRLSLAQVAPSRLDARPASAPGVVPTSEAAPRTSASGDAATAKPTRTWQLFGPAKALSLSLMLSEPDESAAQGAIAAGRTARTSAEAERLSLALTEGRRALADLLVEDAAGVSARTLRLAASAEAAPAGPARFATAFGSVGVSGDGATATAMRVAGLAERDLVQLTSEVPAAGAARGVASQPVASAPGTASRPLAPAPVLAQLAAPTVAAQPAAAQAAQRPELTRLLAASREWTQARPALAAARVPAGAPALASVAQLATAGQRVAALSPPASLRAVIAEAPMGASTTAGIARANALPPTSRALGSVATLVARDTLGEASVDGPTSIALLRSSAPTARAVAPALSLLRGLTPVQAGSERFSKRATGDAALAALVPATLRSALRAQDIGAVGAGSSASAWDLASRGGLVGLATESVEADSIAASSAPLRVPSAERVFLARLSGDEAPGRAPVEPIAASSDARWQTAMGRLVAATESVERSLRATSAVQASGLAPATARAVELARRLPQLDVAVSGLGELVSRASGTEAQRLAQAVSPSLGMVAKRLEQLGRQADAARAPSSAQRLTGAAASQRPQARPASSLGAVGAAERLSLRPTRGVLGHLAALESRDAAPAASLAAEGGLQWASRLLSRVHEEARQAAEVSRSGASAARPMQVAGSVREWISLVDEVAERMPAAAAAEQRAILPMLVRARNAIHAAAEASMPLAAARAAERGLAASSPLSPVSAVGDDVGTAPMRLRQGEIERTTVGLVDFHARLGAGGDEGLARVAKPAVLAAAALPGGAPSAPAAQAVAGSAAQPAGRPAVAREAGATFGATTRRSLRATGGLFDPQSGELRLVRALRSGGATEAAPMAGPRGELVSPLEAVVSRLTQRVSGAPSAATMRVAGAERGVVELPAGAGAEVIGRSEASARMAQAGLPPGEVMRAVTGPSAEAAPGAPRGEVTATPRPARGTVSSIVARIFDEVPSAPLMRSTPSNLVLSGLSFAPERIALAAQGGHEPGLRAARFEAPVFGLRGEPGARAQAAAPRGPVGETVGLPMAAAAAGELGASGRGAASVASARTLGATQAAVAPAAAQERGDSAQAQAWSGLMGLASVLTQVDAGTDAGPGAAARPSAATRLPWLERELTALVGAGADVRWRGRTAPRVSAMAASAASNMLRLLELEGGAEAEVAETFPGVPQPAAPGALVGPDGTVTEAPSTRLGTGPRSARSMQLSAAEQAKREWVEPWAGAMAMQAAPMMDSSAPLARRPGDGGGGGGGGDSSGQDENATPPLHQLQDMAEEVFAIIRERLREEADRFGR